MWRVRYEYLRREYDPLSAATLATPYDMLVVATASLLIAGALFALGGGASYVGRIIHCVLYPTPSAAFR
ncbi:MAG TPA: hypothetical protein VFB07_12945 [Vicinamibacterales bacterium]|nr:hypothetical protein [Vicinamibacterales bacterium]